MLQITQTLKMRTQALNPVDRECCQRDNHVAQGEWMGDNEPSEVDQNAPLKNPLHTRVRQSGTARHLHLLQALATGQQGVQGGVPRGRVSHSTGGRSKRWSSWSTSGSTALCHWVLDEEEAQCGDVSEHSQLFMFTPIPYLDSSVDYMKLF